MVTRALQKPLRLGFVPVTDCAPLVMAHRLGLFARYGLDVSLHRHRSWDAIRDRVLYGELDAAQSLAPLPFAANLALASDQCACVAGLVLNVQGNAITLSTELSEGGVRDAHTLRDFIEKHRSKRMLTLGIAFPHSSQNFLLRQWLRSGGVNPGRDVRIIELPPENMFPNLKLGYLDGYCAGEPWTSVAIHAGAGFCAATSAEIAPLHAQTVLMVRRAFAEERADEHERLIAALLEACVFCDAPQNRGVISSCLAQPQYVNAPAECIGQSLPSPDESGQTSPDPLFNLNIFSRYDANRPDNIKAAWVLEGLSDLREDGAIHFPASSFVHAFKNVFRLDCFEAGLRRWASQRELLSAPASVAG